MHKQFATLTDTLRASVAGILSSGAGDAEELLTKSFQQYTAALDEELVATLGDAPETLAKGLNHISAFASALASMNRTIQALKTGRPTWMVNSDSDGTPEVLPPEVSDQLDRFLRLGVFTLRSMVNDSAELPEDEGDLERAERAGELVKIGTVEGDDILIKSTLPDHFHDLFVDPLELMMDAGDLALELSEIGQGIADALLKANPASIPQEIASVYPNIFEMEKATPPPPQRRRVAPPPPARGNGVAVGGGGSGGGGAGAAAAAANNAVTGDDEGVGDSGTSDFDDAPENPETAPPADDAEGLTDDTPQDPLEMITRLASIIVVLSGSLQQGAAGATADDGTTDDLTDVAGVGGASDDVRNVGLQRQLPLLDMPLRKILANEADITIPEMGDLTFEQLLIDYAALRKQAPAIRQQAQEDGVELATLRQTLERMRTTPAAPTGVTKVMPVSKTDDGMPSGMTLEGTVETLDRLRKIDPEGGLGARLLIAAAHRSGGTPLRPPG